MRKIFFNAMFIAMISLTANAQESFVAEGLNLAIDQNSDGTEVMVMPFEELGYYGDVLIPSTVNYNGKTYTVTTIARDAFYECDCLTSVKLPESLRIIGSRAFSYCKNLKQITLPQHLEAVGEGAFSHCPKISKIVIPNSVKKICANAFYDCKALSSVSIGSGLEVIERVTFCDCTALKTITIPATVKKIEDKAFTGSNLTTVIFKGKGTEYSDFSFTGTPWYGVNSQRAKRVLNDSRLKVNRKNVVVY